MRRTLVRAAALIALVAATPALAEVHEIKMLNRGPDGGVFVYEPEFIQIEPGDTVKFIATDPGHNAASIEGTLPEGAEPFNGGINEEIELTFDEEGLYAYKCTPHFTVGMVGLILVGDEAPNLEAVENARYLGRSSRKMEELIEQARAALE